MARLVVAVIANDMPNIRLNRYSGNYVFGILSMNVFKTFTLSLRSGRKYKDWRLSPRRALVTRSSADGVGYSWLSAARLAVQTWPRASPSAPPRALCRR